MHETSFCFHNLESPPPGAPLNAGRHLLRGWIVPKAGEHFVDVRARIGPRIFAGVHGVPRADLAAFFKTGQSHVLAEFHLAVEFSQGPVEIFFDALNITGSWREFAALQFRAGPAISPVHPPGNPPLRWHDFCRCLDLILRARRHQPDAAWTELAHEFAGDLPYPRDLRAAEQPFIGFIDEPAIVNRRTFGQIPLIGHAFHSSIPIRKIRATADLQVLQTIDCNRLTPAIGAHYAQYPTAKACGFLGFVDVPSQLPNPSAIRIYAEMPDESLHLIHALRTKLHDAEEEKRSYVSNGAEAFDEALTAWRHALQERNIPVLEDADFQPGIDRLRANYLGHSAPSAATAVAPFNAASTATPPIALPRRVLLVSHNLNLEGAPLFLFDYARYLLAAGIEVVVLSPGEGPLQAQFKSAGLTVQVIDIGGVFTATSESEARAVIQTLSVTLEFTSFDLVVANTFTSFWAIHAAKSAGTPALLYVHESTTPANFYLGRVNPWVQSLGEQAFSVADAVSFTTSSTRSYHLDYGPASNHWLTPGWIDVARIDRWIAQNSREALRARLQVQPQELLVTNIGTVCERKGQHIFVRAVDLLWRRHPEVAARARFVMLGGGNTQFDEVIRDLLQQVNRPNLIVHPATSDYFPYYAAADIFVCSTFEESSPRVILEAMAFGTPILSTNVHGIPEQVRDNLDALLVEPGDTFALCEALRELLVNPELGRQHAARARERVVAEFSADKVLPRHLSLAAHVAALK